MPVLPLHSLTSQSLDAKFASKQRRYATNYSATYLHQPSPPPKLAAPPRPPNPTFETLRAAAAHLNLPEEHEQPGPTMAAAVPARRRPVRKALLRTAAVLALCALAAGGTVAWTVRAPDGGLASGGAMLAAVTGRLHDLTAQATLGVIEEKVATLRRALSQALAEAGPAPPPVQEAAETPAPRPAPPPAQPVTGLAASAVMPASPSPPDASGPADAAVSRPPQPAETAASTPDAAGQADAQAEPAPAATPPNAAEAGAAVVTAQQLVNTFALVRQMGLLVRDMQAENERLRAQLAGVTGTLLSRVTGLEQRLAATAHAATPSGDGAAAADPTSPGLARTVHDYHVQAASLGVAVLGDANAMQGQASRHLVAIGDQVPGVGRVISITQRGTSWVVLTDHGVIQ